jgi:hypothetical protein
MVARTSTLSDKAMATVSSTIQILIRPTLDCPTDWIEVAKFFSLDLATLIVFTLGFCFSDSREGYGDPARITASRAHGLATGRVSAELGTGLRLMSLVSRWVGLDHLYVDAQSGDLYVSNRNNPLAPRPPSYATVSRSAVGWLDRLRDRRWADACGCCQCRCHPAAHDGAPWPRVYI